MASADNMIQFRDILLDDPLCRSGYEYAKRQTRLWHGQNAETLRSIAASCLELYHRDENRNSLGIAMYLHQLAASRPEEGN
jgi:hypothetical protein